MNKTSSIFKREMKAYFYSPLAYVVISAFLIIIGYMFTTNILFTKAAYMQGVFEDMVTVMIFFIPLLTMGLLTEERKQGIDQLLFTTPLGVTEFVLGKFLAAFSVYSIMIAFTFMYPAVLDIFGTPDYGSIISAYIGLLLVGGVFLSIGTFASSLTESQVIAGLVSFGILLLLWILTNLKSVLSGSFVYFILRFDLFNYYLDFQQGIIDSNGVIVYLSFIFVFLFLTTRVIDRRRWK